MVEGRSENEEMLKRIGAEWRHAEPPSGSTCIDAETLAAWAEGALPRSQSEAVETHLADCARCQEMAVVFAASEPAAAAAPAATLSWPRRYWMPIAGAAIAASLLIAALMQRGRPVAPTVPVATTATAPAASPVMAPPAPEPRTTPAVKAPVPKPAAESVAATQATPTPAQATPPPAPKPAPPPPPPEPAPLPLPVMPPATPPARFAAPTVLAAPSAPPPLPITVAAAPPALDTRELTRVEATSIATKNVGVIVPVVEFYASRGTAAGVAGGRGGGGGAGRAANVTSAAGAANRWRVLTPVHVEHSIDGGITWTTVDLGSDPVSITQGAAPSSRTCWLVGRDGVVFRSIDSVTFTRLPFPEKIDLISITATDDAHATVTATGGRRFATIDAGQNWVEIK